MKVEPAHLLVGEIRKPHGIRGELYILPRTDNVEEIYVPGRELYVTDVEGELLEPALRLTIVRAREFKKGLIVEFEDVVDRNAAEVLRSRMLAIPADAAPPLGEQEYFLHDLVDLEVQDAEGATIGRVGRIYMVGASHLLGVDDGERERLIPFTGAIVRQVDLDGGVITIEPTPGLLDV